MSFSMTGSSFLLCTAKLVSLSLVFIVYPSGILTNFLTACSIWIEGQTKALIIRGKVSPLAGSGRKNSSSQYGLAVLHAIIPCYTQLRRMQSTWDNLVTAGS